MLNLLEKCAHALGVKWELTVEPPKERNTITVLIRLFVDRLSDQLLGCHIGRRPNEFSAARRDAEGVWHGHYIGVAFSVVARSVSIRHLVSKARQAKVDQPSAAVLV